MVKFDIPHYSDEDRARFIRGLINGLLLSIPFWVAIVWGLSFLF